MPNSPPSVNRVDAFTLIQQSASEAGFVIDDQGDAKWGSRLGDGSYDASIFGWINSGVGVSGVPQIFGTGAASNFNGFSDPSADELMGQLITTTDVDEQTKLQQQIDAKIFAADYGLPFFQSVGVDAVADRVQGIAVGRFGAHNLVQVHDLPFRHRVSHRVLPP